LNGRRFGGRFKGSRRRIMGPRRTGGFFKNGIRAELKYFDFSAGNYNAVITGTTPVANFGSYATLVSVPTVVAPGQPNSGSTMNAIYIINAVAQNTDIYQRIGRKVTWKSLYMRFEITASANGFMTTPVANTSIPSDCRIMILWDSQMNGSTTPIYTDILAVAGLGATAGVGAINASTAMMNLNYRDRYSVIADKHFNLNPMGGASNQIVKIYKNFRKPLATIWNTTTGTPINSGGMIVMVFGANGNSVTPSLTVPANYVYDFTTRLRFTDA